MKLVLRILITLLCCYYSSFSWAIDCASIGDGTLLGGIAFDQGSACGNTANYFIAGTNTITWDGTGGPITGNIEIQNAGTNTGTLRITGAGGTLSGALALSGGTLDVDFTTTLAGTLIINTNSAFDLSSTLAYDGPNISVSTYTFTISGTGHFANTNDIILDETDSSLKLTGNGIIDKVTIGATSNVDKGLNIDGTPTINTFTHSQSARVDIANALTVDQSFSIAAGQTFTLASTGKLILHNGMVLAGSLAIEQPMALAGTISIVEDAIFDLAADLTYTTNSITIGSSTLTIGGTGSLVNSSDIILDNADSLLKLTGSGTINKVTISATGNMSKGLDIDGYPFINTFAHNQSTRVDIANSLTIEQSFSLASGQTFTLTNTGNLILNNGVVLAGTLAIEQPMTLSGTISIIEDTIFDLAADLTYTTNSISIGSSTLTINGTGSFVNSNELLLNTTNSLLKLTGSGTINSVTIGATSNAGKGLDIDGTPTITTLAHSQSARVDIANALTIDQSLSITPGQTFTLTNTGNLILNNGLVLAGTLAIDQPMTLAGTFSIIEDSIFDLAANLTYTTNSISIGSSTLTISGTGSLVNSNEIILDNGNSVLKLTGSGTINKVTIDAASNVGKGLDIVGSPSINTLTHNQNARVDIASALTIDQSLSIASTQTFTLTNTGSLTLNNGVVLAGTLVIDQPMTLSGTFSITGNSLFDLAADLTYNTNSISIGNNSLTISGTGSLVNSNELILDNGDSLLKLTGSGTVNSVTISATSNAGKGLDIDGSPTITTLAHSQSAKVDIANALTIDQSLRIAAGQTFTLANTGYLILNNGMVLAGSLAIEQPMTLSGTISIIEDALFDLAADLTYTTNSISIGSSTLTISGTGSLVNSNDIILNNVDSLLKLTGSGTINKVTIDATSNVGKGLDIDSPLTINTLTHNQNARVDLADTLTLANSLTIGASQTFTLTNTGNLVLSNGMVLNGGTLVVDKAMASTGALSIGANSVFDLSSTLTYYGASISVSSYTFTISGTGSLLNANPILIDNTNSTLKLALTGTVSKVSLDNNDLGKIDVDSEATISALDLNSRTLQLDLASSLSISDTITVVSGKTLSFITTDGGTLKGTGNLQLSGGTLNVDVDTVLWNTLAHSNTSTINIASGKTLIYRGAGFDIGASGTLILQGGGTLILPNTIGLTNGILDLNDVILLVEEDVTISSDIQLSSASTMNIVSGKTLTYGGTGISIGTNTFTITGGGSLSNSSSSIILNDPDSLLVLNSTGTVGSVTISSTGNTGKGLDINESLTISNLTISSTPNGAVYTDIVSGKTLTISSALTVPDTTTLTLAGAGTLDLNGNLTLGNLVGAGTVDVTGVSVTLGTLATTTLSLTTSNTTIVIPSGTTFNPDSSPVYTHVELNGGTLSISSPTTIEGNITHTASSKIDLAAALTYSIGNTIDIGSYELTISGTGGFASTNAINLDQSSSALTLSNNSDISRVTVTGNDLTTGIINVNNNPVVTYLTPTNTTRFGIADAATLTLPNPFEIPSGKTLEWASLGGGTLTLGDTMTVTGTFKTSAPGIVSGQGIDLTGTLDIASSTTILSFIAHSVSSHIAVASTLNYNNDIALGTKTLTISGTGSFYSPTYKISMDHTTGTLVLAGATVVNRVDVATTLTTGKIQVTANATVTDLNPLNGLNLEISDATTFATSDPIEIASSIDMAATGGTWQTNGFVTLNNGYWNSRAGSVYLAGGFLLSSGTLASSSGTVTFINTTINGGTLNMLGTTMSLGGYFYLSSTATLSTDSSTGLSLVDDATLTSNQALSLSTLFLNGKALSLGSTSTDITFSSTADFNSNANSKINTGEADLVLSVPPENLGPGAILSTSGTITFSQGATFSTASTLDITDSTLILAGDLTMSGAAFIATTTSILSLSSNSTTITSDNIISVGSLALNDNSLILGSSDTELAITNAVDFNNNSNTRFFTNLGSLTLSSTPVNTSAGTIASSAGNITFAQGATFTGGTLAISGGTLILGGDLTTTGATLTTTLASLTLNTTATVTADQELSIGVLNLNGYTFSLPSGMTMTLGSTNSITTGKLDISGARLNIYDDTTIAYTNLTYSSTSTFSTITGKTLTISGDVNLQSDTLAIGGSGNVIFSGALTLGTSGTLSTSSDVSVSISGLTTLAGGTLNVTNPSFDGGVKFTSATASGWQFNNSVTLSENSELSSVTLNGDTVFSSDASNSPTVTLNGLDLGGHILTLDNSISPIITGIISSGTINNSGATVSVATNIPTGVTINNGGGIINFGQNGTISGNLTSSGGTLAMEQGGIVSGTVSVSDSGVLSLGGTLNINSGGVLTTDNTITLQIGSNTTMTNAGDIFDLPLNVLGLSGNSLNVTNINLTLESFLPGGGSLETHGLTINGDTSLSSGSITANGAMIINGITSLSGASITANNTLALNGDTTLQSGSITTAAGQTASFNAVADLQGGSITANGPLEFNGTTTLNGSSITANDSLTLNGQTTLQSGSIVVTGNQNIQFQANTTLQGGTITTAGPLTFSNETSLLGGSITANNTLTFDGTVNLESSVITANNALTFNGVSNFNGGEIDLQGGGSLTIDSGADMSGTLNLSTSGFTSTGVLVKVNQDTALALQGNAIIEENLDLNTFDLTGDLALSGNSFLTVGSFSSEAGESLNLSDGIGLIVTDLLTLNGTLNANSETVTLETGAVVSGELNMGQDSSLVLGNVDTTVTLTGNLIFENTNLTLDNTVTLENTGEQELRLSSLTLQDNRLQLNSTDLTLTENFTMSNGEIANNGGILKMSSIFELDGGTLQLAPSSNSQGRSANRVNDCNIVGDPDGYSSVAGRLVLEHESYISNGTILIDNGELYFSHLFDTVLESNDVVLGLTNSFMSSTSRLQNPPGTEPAIVRIKGEPNLYMLGGKLEYIHLEEKPGVFSTHKTDCDFADNEEGSASNDGFHNDSYDYNKHGIYLPPQHRQLEFFQEDEEEIGLKLLSRPDSAVVVTLSATGSTTGIFSNLNCSSSSDGVVIDSDGISFTFDQDDWNVMKNVTCSITGRLNKEVVELQLTTTSSDANYDGKGISLSLLIGEKGETILFGSSQNVLESARVVLDGSESEGLRYSWTVDPNNYSGVTLERADTPIAYFHAPEIRKFSSEDLSFEFSVLKQNREGKSEAQIRVHAATTTGSYTATQIFRPENDKVVLHPDNSEVNAFQEISGGYTVQNYSGKILAKYFINNDESFSVCIFPCTETEDEPTVKAPKGSTLYINPDGSSVTEFITQKEELETDRSFRLTTNIHYGRIFHTLETEEEKNYSLFSTIIAHTAVGVDVESSKITWQTNHQDANYQVEAITNFDDPQITVTLTKNDELIQNLTVSDAGANINLKDPVSLLANVSYDELTRALEELSGVSFQVALGLLDTLTVEEVLRRFSDQDREAILNQLSEEAFSQLPILQVETIQGGVTPLRFLTTMSFDGSSESRFEKQEEAVTIIELQKNSSSVTIDSIDNITLKSSEIPFQADGQLEGSRTITINMGIQGNTQMTLADTISGINGQILSSVEQKTTTISTPAGSQTLITEIGTTRTKTALLTDEKERVMQGEINTNSLGEGEVAILITSDPSQEDLSNDLMLPRFIAGSTVTIAGQKSCDQSGRTTANFMTSGNPLYCVYLEIPISQNDLQWIRTFNQELMGMTDINYLSNRSEIKSIDQLQWGYFLGTLDNESVVLQSIQDDSVTLKLDVASDLDNMNFQETTTALEVEGNGVFYQGNEFVSINQLSRIRNAAKKQIVRQGQNLMALPVFAQWSLSDLQLKLTRGTVSEIITHSEEKFSYPWAISSANSLVVQPGQGIYAIADTNLVVKFRDLGAYDITPRLNAINNSQEWYLLGISRSMSVQDIINAIHFSEFVEDPFHEIDEIDAAGIFQSDKQPPTTPPAIQNDVWTPVLLAYLVIIGIILIIVRKLKLFTLLSLRIEIVGKHVLRTTLIGIPVTLLLFACGQELLLEEKGSDPFPIPWQLHSIWHLRSVNSPPQMDWQAYSTDSTIQEALKNKRCLDTDTWRTLQEAQCPKSLDLSRTSCPEPVIEGGKGFWVRLSNNTGITVPVTGISDFPKNTCEQ